MRFLLRESGGLPRARSLTHRELPQVWRKELDQLKANQLYTDTVEALKLKYLDVKPSPRRQAYSSRRRGGAALERPPLPSFANFPRLLSRRPHTSPPLD